MNKLQICNTALSMAAINKTIDNIDTDTSAISKILRNLYEIAVDTVFTETTWNCMLTNETLVVIRETPNQKWKYALQKPNNLLSIKNATNNNGENISFTTGIFEKTNVIFANEKNVNLEFSKKTTEIYLLETYITNLIIIQLAILIAINVSKDQSLINNLGNNYKNKLISAIRMDVNNAKLKTNTYFNNNYYVDKREI